jgi:hypothetical protein
MTRYHILAPLVLSFYSKSLYQDVGRNWRGKAFLYLLLLVIISWVPVLIRMQADFAKFVDSEGSGMVQQMPHITIKNREVSTDVETPYFIKNPKTGKTVIIIDLTGKFTSLEGSEAGFLLTKNQLIAKRSARETRVYDLSSVTDLSIDRPTMERWLRFARGWLGVVLFPVAVAGSYAYRLVQAFIYGLIGLLFAKYSHASLDYMALVRLELITITPVLLLDTVLDLSSVKVPYWPFLCFLIAMGYLYFGVKANAAPPPVPITLVDPNPA